ncbi:SgcJ/EcaC family oxidoreductase [Spirosoma endbachense]|uniref:SgcJ/EcaC family oxidoreductase n=1 Tax=Spirosoma endbachense TaxID=2666025 RepID=A0A6P1VVI9_9BACT|nr:SgcJ/EcaC family oxidoreductase [Spirosoma endbachense]QHV95669.1 SgcJ/EcaC family oxidoreductase [Spirosoma endbachense]
MKIRSAIKSALVFTLILTSASLRAQNVKDSVSIQGILQQEDQAWNKGDAPAYSQPFSTDGTFTNIAGMFFKGHKAFLDQHEVIFKSFFKNTVLKQKIVSLKFVRSDVALLETLCQVSGFAKEGLPPRLQLDAKGQLNTRLLQVLAKEAGGWKVVSYHNVDIKPGTPIPE